MSTHKNTQKAPNRDVKIANAASLGFPEPATPDPTAIPPPRVHSASYHWPLLLNDKGSCDGLLEWFSGTEEDRDMPWRKKWIDPADYEDEEELAKVLSRRAYEVWVSEIMLQQTRVSTVIPYFKNWIAKWPTVQDLAKADHDDVLAAWKGLGFYSRATRLQTGAQDMVIENDKNCPIPSSAEELMTFSGIGRYTAGAVSSIAFGEAEPVLDGNVIRVLSRQLGLFADGKDKKSSDLLWKVADRLVKHVSNYSDCESPKSAIPGLWNQALMELGSTVCTPRPKCDGCPIQKTCRAYSEGELLDRKVKPPAVLDIEDACNFCDQLDTEDLLETPEENDKDNPKPNKRGKREIKSTNTISQYFAASTPTVESQTRSQTRSQTHAEEDDGSQPAILANGANKRKAPGSTMVSKSVTAYCSLFPKKIPKKKVAEEESVVCLVELRTQGGPSKWLIEQRPAKGLLASLWQFPQSTVSVNKSASYRKTTAVKFVSQLSVGPIDMSKAKHVAEFDSLLHIFSHLKLSMHVHWFVIAEDSIPEVAFPGPPRRKWVETEEMGNETLSTGMRRCWELVKNSTLFQSIP